MFEQLKYINHRNESIDFGQSCIFVNHNDLHDYSWAVTSKNNRISSFSKGVITRNLPVVIQCKSEKEGIALRNKLFELCEKDVLAHKHGRIVIGDYYLKCFITGSKKQEYLITKGYMKATLAVTTDFPYWIRETTTTFGYGIGTVGSNLDFNRDFPYDYTSNLESKALNNTGFVATNFRLNIYGLCENPKITIAGHDYEVAVSVAANEFLSIDSVAKTITLTHTDGTVENCFNLRNKESYIFEKIPSGVSEVATNGDFKFDVVLLEERSEPKWT